MKDLLEREKIETSKQKLTFSITYCSAFQTVSNILQKLNLLLALDRGH